MNLNDSATDLGRLEAYPTADGSFSLHSAHFGEAFHNSAGALNEARAKFVEPAQLGRFQQKQSLAVLDVCFGLGYNSAAVMEALPEQAALQWWGLELDQRPLGLALEQATYQRIWSTSVLKRLQALRSNGGWTTKHSTGQMLWGDARSTLSTIAPEQHFDLILQDAFSPQRCPELWSEEFLGSLARRLKPGGRLLTYSRSAAVRASLQRAGLELFSLLAAPREKMGWSNGTMAVRPGKDMCPVHGPGWRSFSTMELEHLSTRAAIPFRDISGNSTSKEILKQRKLEQSRCELEPTNAWQRRWGLTKGKQVLEERAGTAKNMSVSEGGQQAC